MGWMGWDEGTSTAAAARGFGLSEWKRRARGGGPGGKLRPAKTLTLPDGALTNSSQARRSGGRLLAGYTHTPLVGLSSVAAAECRHRESTAGQGEVQMKEWPCKLGVPSF